MSETPSTGTTGKEIPFVGAKILHRVGTNLHVETSYVVGSINTREDQ